MFILLETGCLAKVEGPTANIVTLALINRCLGYLIPIPGPGVGGVGMGLGKQQRAT